MKLNSVFQTASVPIPDRSGFDLSREHLATASVGTLVPLECIEVLPNDTISMGALAKTTLPPFAVPFMGRVDMCMEAFFVPTRILWRGWQAFITQNAGFQNNAAGTIGGASSFPQIVPCIDLADADNVAMMGPGSLADYLGFKTNGSTTASISALKFLAYHRIVDDWYRDSNNMKPFFEKTPFGNTQPVNEHLRLRRLPSMDFYDGSGLNNYDWLFPLDVPASTEVDANQRVDGTIGLGSLRQRCWAKDYFTTATSRPQAGDNAVIQFTTANNSGTISVADIRAANALQKWLERNNIAGTDYGSQILAHFGVTPPDSVLDKPLLLGQVRESVYVGSVENNSNAEQTSGTTRNPYGNTLGSAAGFGSGMGKGSLVNDFHAKEHGFIMVLYSLVPHAYYNSGCERELMHKTIGDFAWPEYARIGDQLITQDELWAGAASGVPFGYNQRYSEYKFRLDKISGLLRDGQSLDVYALQRGFSANQSLGKNFLEIPTNYLDQVFALSSQVGNFGCIVDAFFDTRAIRLLPQYSLPSL